MPKRIMDMISGETARKVKNMSVPELNTYLYAIYKAGYADGYADRLQLAARIAAIEPGEKKQEEADPGG